MPEFSAPDTFKVSEDHVRSALDFLIAVEPEPPPESREEYDAATEPYTRQIAMAMATLRSFAEQTQPTALDQMRVDYYGFTNDPHYLVSSDVSAIVRGSLNEAWNGVGPWRR